MPPEAPCAPPDILVLTPDAEAAAALLRLLERAGSAAQQSLFDPCRDHPALAVLPANADCALTIATLRRQGLMCPLLVIGDTAEGPQLLQAGADALLRADAPVSELAALVRALARRRVNRVPAERQLPDATVLAAALQLRLTPTEQRILEVLARRPGRVVTRDLIVDTLYAGADAPRSSTVDVFVHGLRRKMDGKVSGVKIETVRGAGFRLAVS